MENENKLDLLTKKIYQEGIEKANNDAQEILDKARKDAENILKDAENRAKDIVDKANDDAANVKQKTEALKLSLAAKEESDSSLAKFISLVRSYTDVKELTPEILNSFIDKIYIGKPERIDGQRVQEVKIIYKLVGAVNIPQ